MRLPRPGMALPAGGSKCSGCQLCFWRTHLAGQCPLEGKLCTFVAHASVDDLVRMHGAGADLPLAASDKQMRAVGAPAECETAVLATGSWIVPKDARPQNPVGPQPLPAWKETPSPSSRFNAQVRAAQPASGKKEASPPKRGAQV